MTVGFHAPLPPARTGVADYAAALLQALRKRGDIRVDAKSADIHLYHLGNNQLHRDIYDRAMLQPGVVVLHDAVLHHFYLGAFHREHYLREYVHNYGAWEEDVAGELWRERSGSAMDQRYFHKPMLKRVGERSLAVIVHNPAAAEAVKAHTPHAKVIEIPHLFDTSAEIEDRARIRRKLCLGEETFVFGIFGYLRESKRIVPILQCFERLHERNPRVRLLLAGSLASSDLERAMEPWLSHPGIVRLPYQSNREFWKVTAAVDCCLNLRYPGAGETSGIGVRLMGLGKVVFFTDGPEIARIPSGACIRVSPGIEEKAELLAYMTMVAETPEAVRIIGQTAAAYVRDSHSIELVADRYWETLCGLHALSH